MHFLAHLHLSGESEERMIGNFVGEVLKIKNPDKYDERILEGLLMHDSIDEFTHNHPIVKRSMERLGARNAKNADKIIDVYYDHFLAANWESYSTISLNEYVAHVHKVLLKNQDLLPFKVKFMLPALIKGNWLGKYATLGGVHQATIELNKKATAQFHILQAMDDVINNYPALKQDFAEFYPELVEFVNNQHEFKQINLEAITEQLAWVG
jgi:acyl carrier protein phosphodiesterase